jgi:hypothetical protein
MDREDALKYAGWFRAYMLAVGAISVSELVAMVVLDVIFGIHSRTYSTFIYVSAMGIFWFVMITSIPIACVMSMLIREERAQIRAPAV